MSTTRRYTFKPANAGASIGHGPTRSLTGRYGQIVSLTDRDAYFVVQGYAGESGACLVADVGDAAEQAASQAILTAIAGGETYAPEAPLSDAELARVRTMDAAEVDTLAAADIAALQAMRAANVDDLSADDVSVIVASNLADGDTLAKAADVPAALTDLSDTPVAMGTAGQVLKVNGAADALEFGDAGGGFVHNPLHWMAAAGAKGVGTDTPLTLAAYPDLSVADGGKALSAYQRVGGTALFLDADVSVDPTKPAGIDLGDLGVGESGARAVFLQPIIRTTSTVGDINDSYDWSIGIYAFKTNTAGDFVGGGVKQAVSDKAGAAGFFWWSGTDRNQAFAVTGFDAYSAPRPSDGFALLIDRDGTSGDVTIYAGNGLRKVPIFHSAAFHTGALKFVLMMHGDTSTVPVGCYVENIGEFDSLPAPAVA